MSERLAAYKRNFTEEDAPGLDAITDKEREIYGPQEPHHWATILPYELGGKDPLWGVNCFVNEKQVSHFHYVTMGFSKLFYNEELAEEEVSGFGFELTFRHLPVEGDPEKPVWPVNMMQNLARYVFSSGNAFDDLHFMSANGPLRLGSDTEITAIIFYTDPEMGEIDTPHGYVKFLQLFGITTNEYNDLQEKKYTAKELLEKHKEENPLLVTDLNRKYIL